jgi:DNA-directed RNA polymerase specialized sigma24 family protein
MTSFEDGVVFCVDVERCLAKLRKEDQRLIKRIALQGYTHEEAAPLLGITFKTCVVNYGTALDRVTELFLANRLMEPQKMLSRP